MPNLDVGAFPKWTSRIFSILAILFNVILIIVIRIRRSSHIGGYRHLLSCFAVFDICYAVFELFVGTAVLIHKSCFCVFTRESFISETPIFSIALVSLRSSLVGMSFVLLAIHFFYRYYAVCRPTKMHHFQRPFYILLWLNLFLAHGFLWFGISLLNLPTSATLVFMRESFEKTYFIRVEDVGMICLYYFSPERWTRFASLTGVALGSITVLIIVYLYIYLTLKIVRALETLTMSSSMRNLHRQLLRALVIQTLIPIFSNILPCSVIWITPVFENDEIGSHYNHIIVPLLGIFCWLDPMAVLFVISEYWHTATYYLRSIYQKHSSSIFAYAPSAVSSNTFI
ncbi:unnamed protein product [Caenorhabditis auriculariae]|uniref:G-protein coupled receptors family 1 profile domain-containing protein n=1 Tax=Caenorhabditis auriculariae TaxID=2777116 RepID=A0A8S1GUF7_9PELO|nr:unnamed protein product [Caenorhabditis auriculariae]